MGRKCKTGLTQNPLFYEKKDENALPYLEAVAITFYRISKVVFLHYKEN
jgi:hypothetical protein